MVRRIGFGERSSDHVEPVRRRGSETAPSDHTSEQVARRQEAPKPGRRAAPPRPRRAEAAADPWSTPETPPAAARRKGLGFGRIIFLGFLWTILINWTLAAYGGLSGAIAVFRGLSEGYVDPVPALFPAIMPLAIGIFVSQLILGRRKRR